MRVAKVAFVWESEVNLLLCKRVGDLIGVHAGRETRDNFLGTGDVCVVQDVVVNEQVVT